MEISYYTMILFLFLVSVTNAQEKKKLEFNENGEFKIAQFSDTHIENKKNLEAYNIIRKITQQEKPDLVVLTGDIVTQDDPQDYYKRFENLFADAGVPWVMIFGNHDSEHNFSRKALSDFLQQLPSCLNDDKGDTYGNSNFVFTVSGKQKKDNALLYFMDSNVNSTLKPMVGGSGWFDFSQINWYRKKSKAYTQLNGGTPMPALAFFHIPLPEYTNAWNNKINPPIGVRNEDECCPKINTGMFAAMLECGDVMGTFVGHDHINDYIGVYYGIALAYGRISKIMPDPEEDPLAGGRIIVLKEGQRSFETWIRVMNGDKVQECTWPDSFSRPEK